MGYPNWLIDRVIQSGWKFKREAYKYKIYQSPTSLDRILIHKRTRVDERVARAHLKKIGMPEDEIASFLKKHSEYILKKPAKKSVKKK